jgi:hypothetical protein
VAGRAAGSGEEDDTRASAQNALEEAIHAEHSVERRTIPVKLIFWLAAGAFLILGAISLRDGFAESNSSNGGSLLVLGSVGLALGICFVAFSIAWIYRKDWFGSWAKTYDDRPGRRWAVAPTPQEMEELACPRCRAPNVRVSPACWKCGLEFPKSANSIAQPKVGP